MIIPLSRSFRQKSDAHLTKTKVATGKATRRDEEGERRERDSERRKKKKQSERWWKNRGSGRRNKKNTERERKRQRKGERIKAEERAKARSGTREIERERERSSTSNSPPSPFSSIEDTLRLSVPSYVLALSPADRPYTLACTPSRTRSHACTYSTHRTERVQKAVVTLQQPTFPARLTPSRRPSLGRRVPALSVFPRPVPTTPFHAVSRRACPYTSPTCNCPLYRL